MQKTRGQTPAGLLLSLDPGDTTGWAVFQNANLIRCGQLRVHSLADLSDLIQGINPTHIVYEGYRVYKHKLEQHVGSEVPTIQYVGAIKLTAELTGIPYTQQWAFQAKGFCTDARLKDLGLYQNNRRHANDAMRHAVYWYIFHRN